jgi:cytochrome c oxidase subunit 4
MSSQHDSHNGKDPHKGEGPSPHFIIPISVMIAVWIALLIGTVITVAVSYVDFGSLNMVIAMLVATCKAALVMAFFMGLKYDTLENSLTFLSSFVFLGIFITLTSFDVFWRPAQEAAQIDRTAVLTASGPVNMSALLARSPENLAKGKALFATTCAVCHGPEGKGNGPGAVALNPKPRNFTQQEGWKNGRKLSGIFKTLTEGIKGGGMAAYNGLSIEDRFALAHHVQSLGGDAPADSPADVAALGLENPGKPEITVEEGITRLVGKGETPVPQAYAYVQGKGYAAAGDVGYQRGVVSQPPEAAMPKAEYCKLPEQYRPKSCP